MIEPGQEDVKRKKAMQIGGITVVLVFGKSNGRSTYPSLSTGKD